MTKNQLDYQKNYETRRHNLESEREQEYANVSGRLSAQAALTSAGAAVRNAAVNEFNADTRAGELAETRRHNLYSEDTARRTVQATESRVTAQNYADIGKGTGYLFQAVGKLAQVAATFG